MCTRLSCSSIGVIDNWQLQSANKVTCAHYATLLQYSEQQQYYYVLTGIMFGKISNKLSAVQVA